MLPMAQAPTVKERGKWRFKHPQDLERSKSHSKRFGNIHIYFDT